MQEDRAHTIGDAATSLHSEASWQREALSARLVFSSAVAGVCAYVAALLKQRRQRMLSTKVRDGGGSVGFVGMRASYQAIAGMPSAAAAALPVGGGARCARKSKHTENPMCTENLPPPP